MPFNREKVLETIYAEIAKLGFGDLVLLNTQLSEHIWNCWQHHQLQIEKAREENQKEAKH